MYKLDIELTPSKILLSVTTLMHLFAIFCLTMLVIHWHIAIIVIFAALAIIFYSYYYCLTQYVLLTSRSAWVNIMWDPLSACWLLQNRQKMVYQVTLLPSSIITIPFLLLNFKIRGQFFSVAVLMTTDNVNKNDLRKLRVILNNGYAIKKHRSTTSQPCKERQQTCI